MQTVQRRAQRRRAHRARDHDARGDLHADRQPRSPTSRSAWSIRAFDIEGSCRVTDRRSNRRDPVAELAIERDDAGPDVEPAHADLHGTTSSRSRRSSTSYSSRPPAYLVPHIHPTNQTNQAADLRQPRERAALAGTTRSAPTATGSTNWDASSSAASTRSRWASWPASSPSSWGPSTAWSRASSAA